MTQALIDIQTQLEEPFALADIDLLPKGKSERDGKVTCMALPYADKRVYEDRLNHLAPGEWSTPQPLAIVVGQKLVVYVTVIVCGIAHTDVGEAAASGENAATESYAQAFKRACSQFGLGRYLYDLEKAWVPFNAQKKQIDLNASQIQNVVRKMYSAAGIGVNASRPSLPVQEQTSNPTGDATKSTHQPVQIEAGKGAPTTEAPDEIARKQRLNAAFMKAMSLNQFTSSTSKEKKTRSAENSAAFLKWAAGVLGDILLTSASQLNAERLDEIEAYLNSQDAA